MIVPMTRDNTATHSISAPQSIQLRRFRSIRGSRLHGWTCPRARHDIDNSGGPCTMSSWNMFSSVWVKVFKSPKPEARNRIRFPSTSAATPVTVKRVRSRRIYRCHARKPTWAPTGPDDPTSESVGYKHYLAAVVQKVYSRSVAAVYR